MSELQLGLLIIGALVVIAVVAYNKWQENRLRRRTESAFATVHEDVLLGGAKAASYESGGDIAMPAPMPAQPAPEQYEPAPERFEDTRVEHVLGDIESVEPVTPEVEAADALPFAVLNEALDCIATLECPSAVTGDRIAARAQPLFDDEVARRVYWEAFDESDNTWGAVQPDQAYTRVRLGFQLATQAGAVSQYQLESFASSSVELALALSADVNVIDTEAAMQQAARLDKFCADFDVQVGLSVVTDETHTIPGTKIRGVAESAGFILGKDGRYHRYDEDGLELYMLSNMEPMPFHIETIRTLTTRGVTLLLNVPRAPGTPTTFRSYIKFARLLAEALDGTLVDDNRQPIGERAIEQVGTQLSAIHDAMSAGGIPAGSAAARRLFA